jgi:prepilin signal peptidase PulO-like enzyme (type II secretory pathway)
MITYIIIAIMLGWLAGVLVNYLADVLPLRRRLSKPFCVQCDSHLAWKNYLIWPRKCPVCSHPRSIRTWIVEGSYIVASIYLMLNPPNQLGYLLGMIVLVYFGIVVVIDLEYRLIMHPVSVAGALLGLLVGILRVGWLNALIGGVIGFGVMWLMYMLGVLILKLLARRRGELVNDVALGFGDVNLSGVLGLMLGWPGVLIGLLVAILVAGAVSLIYIIIKLITRKYEAFMAIPYGPFLVIGAAIIIF